MVVGSVSSQPAHLCTYTVVTVTHGLFSPHKWEGVGAGSLPPAAGTPRGARCGWNHAGDWRGLVHSVDTDVVHVSEGMGGGYAGPPPPVQQGYGQGTVSIQKTGGFNSAAQPERFGTPGTCGSVWRHFWSRDLGVLLTVSCG